MEKSAEKPEGGDLRLLRAAGLIALLVGTVGSTGLMLRTGQHASPLLLAIFTVWVLYPYGAMAWANVASKRWPALKRATLYWVMVVVALGSLAIYGHAAFGPRRVEAASIFVVVPPASGLLIVAALSIAGLISSRRSRQSGG